MSVLSVWCLVCVQKRTAEIQPKIAANVSATQELAVNKSSSPKKRDSSRLRAKKSQNKHCDVSRDGMYAKKTISQECFVIEDLISSLDPPRIFFNRLPLIRWPAPPLSPVRTFPDRPAMGNLACRVAFR